MNLIAYLFSIIAIITLYSCSENNNKAAKVNPMYGIQQANWGEYDSKKVYLFTLTNHNGIEVKITNYGATVTSWITSDMNGKKDNIVLGFDSLDGYLQKPPYFGATIGRYGNRIADARFTIGDSSYKLAANNGKNHLHGGIKGFDKQLWDILPISDSIPALTLTRISKDGEEGYPGNLKVTVSFSLIEEDELKIEYTAETDKTTPVNLTNHSYFNLTGDVTHNILDHILWIDADRYTPVDSTLIPTGVLETVKGSAFDFTRPKKIGARIESVKGGYDHNFVLNKNEGSYQLVASVKDSVSGRKLEVYTTEPGLQFYSGNFLDGTIKIDGKLINQHTAFCLETQHFPNSPNQQGFPSTLLKPGEKYHTRTAYKVSKL